MVEGYGFGRDARLRLRREFLAVQGAGRRRFTRHFIIFTSRGPGDTGRADRGARIGITASRRVGNAVVRNRWKRIAREAFRHLRPKLDPRLDIVIICRAGAEPPSFDDARAELASALLRRRSRPA